VSPVHTTLGNEMIFVIKLKKKERKKEHEEMNRLDNNWGK
jgi:hypothetical protein